MSTLRNRPVLIQHQREREEGGRSGPHRCRRCGSCARRRRLAFDRRLRRRRRRATVRRAEAVVDPPSLGNATFGRGRSIATLPPPRDARQIFPTPMLSSRCRRYQRRRGRRRRRREPRRRCCFLLRRQLTSAHDLEGALAPARLPLPRLRERGRIDDGGATRRIRTPGIAGGRPRCERREAAPTSRTRRRRRPSVVVVPFSSSPPRSGEEQLGEVLAKLTPTGDF